MCCTGEGRLPLTGVGQGTLHAAGALPPFVQSAPGEQRQGAEAKEQAMSTPQSPTTRGGQVRRAESRRTGGTPAGGARRQVKTRVKAGGLVENHNATLVRVQKPTPGLEVKTQVKA